MAVKDRELKCANKHCKLGGHVMKSEAIKDGSYYHKQCHQIKMDKKAIREKYYDRFKSKETATAVNGAISKFVDKDGFDSGYVLWCLGLPSVKLNSLYGLSRTLGYKKNEEEYNKYVASRTKIDWDKVEIIERKDVKVKKTTNNVKLWGDLFD